MADRSASLSVADGGREEEVEAELPVDDEVTEAPTAVPLTSANGSVLPIAELEKQAICNALHQTGGNRTQAATLLGISIRPCATSCRSIVTPHDLLSRPRRKSRRRRLNNWRPFAPIVSAVAAPRALPPKLCPPPRRPPKT